MISLLIYSMVNSFPSFVLQIQRRMLKGLSNLLNDIFYDSMTLLYAETCNLITIEHDTSRRREE